MKELPEGVVTFLFTDVEGSTRLFEEAPDAMLEALSQHDRVIEEAVTAHDGAVVRPRGEGDSRFIVFQNAISAVAGAIEMQRSLAAVDWGTPDPLLVRAALHTGVANLRSGDYYGSAVNRAARLRGIAHGGQTLMSRSTWELVRDELPDGVTVQDLGEHALKDLIRPERVFQVTAEGLRDKFPPLASLNIIANNLPEQLTEFVGRQAELADAIQLISETRLLTFLAPGGTGKTRLAIQTAAEVSSDFPDGVFFISLAEIESSDDIVQAIIETLGVAFSGDADAQSQLLTYLSPRQQLLVFDNLEQLEGAAGIISKILKAAPRVKVLATSRTKLNLSGETVMPLSGLDITWTHPHEVMQASGAQLFVEAAKRSNPNFVLESDDLDDLAQILSLVGGMPLGILLAAAWVDMLAIRDIASEIKKSFDFLETEMGDFPSRQRSIRAVFDSSWGLLKPQEQDIFKALSVFRGGFNREAAEEVAGASLRSLANLVNKSLITANPDTGRYQVHELLRQYAAAELEHDHDHHQKIREAHAAFYSGLMGETPDLMTHGQQRKMISMIDNDIDNIRTAWRYYITTGNASEARKFMLGLFIINEFRGWYSASAALFDEALNLLPEDSEDEATRILRAVASAVKGWSMTMLSQPVIGVMSASQPADFLAQPTTLLEHWITVQCLALGLAYLGSVNEMRKSLEKAIELHKSFGEEFWVASLQDWDAFAAVLGGDLDSATQLTHEAIKVVKSTDEYWVTTWNLWVRAMVATQENRPEDAIRLYSEQIALCSKVSFVRGIMVSMDGLGEANQAAGKLEAAEKAFIEAMAAADRMGMVRDVLSMITKVAKIRAAKGEPLEAVELLATVLAEPISIYQPFTDSTPINEAVLDALTELEEKVESQAYSEAYARGAERAYNVAAKELILEASRDSSV